MVIYGLSEPRAESRGVGNIGGSIFGQIGLGVSGIDLCVRVKCGQRARGFTAHVIGFGLLEGGRESAPVIWGLLCGVLGSHLDSPTLPLRALNTYSIF